MISSAFTPIRSILPPPRPRRKVDMEAFPRGAGAGGSATGSARGRELPFDFEGFDFSDLGGRPAENPPDPASGWGGCGTSSPACFPRDGQIEPGPQDGSDLEYQVTVDFWTAIRGGVAKIQITRQETCPSCKGKPSGGGGTCPECQGTGQVTQMGGRMKFNISCPECKGTGKLEDECSTCGGEGTITRTETVEVRIKAGTRDGQRIRLAGKGNAGVNGGPAGDLYLIIKIKTHPVFNRTGDDIQVTIPITVPKLRWAPRSRCRRSTGGRN